MLSQGKDINFDNFIFSEYAKIKKSFKMPSPYTILSYKYEYRKLKSLKQNNMIIISSNEIKDLAKITFEKVTKELPKEFIGEVNFSDTTRLFLGTMLEIKIIPRIINDKGERFESPVKASIFSICVHIFEDKDKEEFLQEFKKLINQK